MGGSLFYCAPRASAFCRAAFCASLCRRGAGGARHSLPLFPPLLPSLKILPLKSPPSWRGEAPFFSLFFHPPLIPPRQSFPFNCSSFIVPSSTHAEPDAAFPSASVANTYAHTAIPFFLLTKRTACSPPSPRRPSSST